jgi:hypothetical protein
MHSERWYWLEIFCVVSLFIHIVIGWNSRTLGIRADNFRVQEIEVALEPWEDPKPEEKKEEEKKPQPQVKREPQQRIRLPRVVRQRPVRSAPKPVRTVRAPAPKPVRMARAETPKPIEPAPQQPPVVPEERPEPVQPQQPEETPAPRIQAPPMPQPAVEEPDPAPKPAAAPMPEAPKDPENPIRAGTPDATPRVTTNPGTRSLLAGENPIADAAPPDEKPAAAARTGTASPTVGSRAARATPDPNIVESSGGSPRRTAAAPVDEGPASSSIGGGVPDSRAAPRLRAGGNISAGSNLLAAAAIPDEAPGLPGGLGGGAGKGGGVRFRNENAPVSALETGTNPGGGFTPRRGPVEVAGEPGGTGASGFGRSGRASLGVGRSRAIVGVASNNPLAERVFNEEKPGPGGGRGTGVGAGKPRYGRVDRSDPGLGGFASGSGGGTTPRRTVAVAGEPGPVSGPGLGRSQGPGVGAGPGTRSARVALNTGANPLGGAVLSDDGPGVGGRSASASGAGVGRFRGDTAPVGAGTGGRARPTRTVSADEPAPAGSGLGRGEGVGNGAGPGGRSPRLALNRSANPLGSALAQDEGPGVGGSRSPGVAAGAGVGRFRGAADPVGLGAGSEGSGSGAARVSADEPGPGVGLTGTTGAGAGRTVGLPSGRNVSVAVPTGPRLTSGAGGRIGTGGNGAAPRGIPFAGGGGDDGTVERGGGGDQGTSPRVGAGGRPVRGPASPSTDDEGVHIVYVLDASPSVSWKGRMVRAKAALRKALDELGAVDTFNIVDFAGDSKRLSPEMLKPTADNLKRARDYLDKIEMRSTTNLAAAFDTVFSLKPVTHVFLLSDGEANSGAADPAVVRRLVKQLNTQRAQIIAVALGTKDDGFGFPLLRALAADTGGQFSFIKLK